MLKRSVLYMPALACYQPPSGGCVLKRLWVLGQAHHLCSAAFGRLRVETKVSSWNVILSQSSAAFGRLRVETPNMGNALHPFNLSRLRAAAC